MAMHIRIADEVPSAPLVPVDRRCRDEVEFGNAEGGGMFFDC